jgi:hypothetical protein
VCYTQEKEKPAPSLLVQVTVAYRLPGTPHRFTKHVVANAVGAEAIVGAEAAIVVTEG